VKPGATIVASRIHAFADGLHYARQIARLLSVSPAIVKVHHFPDRETLVRVAPNPSRHAILVRSFDTPNAKLIETIFAADALRRAGSKRVTLVAPYLAYMRQDRVFHPGEPISQRVIGDFLGRYFDAVLTMEPHLHRVKSLREIIASRSRVVSAAPAIARWIRSKDCVVIGPDSESGLMAKSVAKILGASFVVGEKTRIGDRRVSVRLGAMPHAGRAVIVDDIASSGVTMAAAVRAVREAGIATVDAVIVHAIFAPGAIESIRGAGARRVVSCDTIAHETNAITTASLFADALKDSE